MEDPNTTVYHTTTKPIDYGLRMLLKKGEKSPSSLRAREVSTLVNWFRTVHSTAVTAHDVVRRLKEGTGMPWDWMGINPASKTMRATTFNKDDVSYGVEALSIGRRWDDGRGENVDVYDLTGMMYVTVNIPNRPIEKRVFPNIGCVTAFIVNRERGHVDVEPSGVLLANSERTPFFLR